MPKGRIPKPDGERSGHRPLLRVRNAPTGAMSAPPLPEAPSWLTGGWPAQTVAWFENWADALDGQLSSVGWAYLIDTALVHATVWGKGEVKHLPELRLREAKLGLATPEDRARLGMEASSTAEPEPAPERTAPTGRRSWREMDLRVVDTASLREAGHP